MGTGYENNARHDMDEGVWEMASRLLVCII